MKKETSYQNSAFFIQKRPNEGAFVLFLSAGVYVLLVIWAILFKFSRISEIYTKTTMTIPQRVMNGLRLFDFFSETNPKRFWHECLVAIGNLVLFVPIGVNGSFFFNKGRAILLGCAFSCVVECIQLFAYFGVFSFEDIILNTLGVVLGVLIYCAIVCHIPQRVVKGINSCLLFVGIPVTFAAYFSVVAAMKDYLS